MSRKTGVPWPLALTPFEWFQVTADTPETPMTFFVRTEFRGRLDADALTHAVHEAVLRHPLLCAHLAGASPAGLQWVPATDTRCQFQVVEDAPLRFRAGEPIDLRTETGLRVWLRLSEDSSEVRFQFHHACCDGLGALSLIEDVLCLYDQIVHGPDSEARLRPLDDRLLAARARLAQKQSSLRDRLRRNLLVVPRRVWRFFGDRADPIATTPPSAPVRTDDRLPEQPCHVFGRTEAKQLRRTAFAQGASTNELLLRDLFLVIDGWNAARGAASRAGALRLLVPVSLRDQTDDALPAVNKVSLVALSRPRSACRDPERLLESVSAEMNDVQRWQLDRSWVRATALLRKFSPLYGLAARSLGPQFASSRMANLGRVFARARIPRESGRILAGGARLESVGGAGPYGADTKFTLSAMSYAGRLSLAVNANPRSVSADDARALLAEYVRRLELSAGLR